MTLEDWLLKFPSTKDSIKACRRILGLAEIKEMKVPCKICKKLFIAQIVGKVRTEFYCLGCKWIMHHPHRPRK